MSPPQLAAYAPVLDVLQPDTVGVFVFFRNKPYYIVHHRGETLFCEMLHLHKPLQRQSRLNGHLGAFGKSDVVHVVLFLFHKPGGGKIGGNGLPHIETVHAHIHAGTFRYRSVVVEDVDGFKIVGLAEHVVVFVVRGSYLEAACAELDVDIAVLYHRYLASHQRHNHTPSLEPYVLWVLGIDTHRRIAHYGFRTCRGHKGVVTAIAIGMHDASLWCGPPFSGFGIGGEIIFQIVQFGLLLLEEHLIVAYGCLVLRIPVHHAQSAVYQPLVIEIDEYLHHALAPLLIHSERSAIPVTGCAQFTQLFQNYASMLLGPLPGVGQKLFSGKIGFSDAFGREFGNHLCFGAYRGMVGSRNPQCVISFHARTPHKNILYGIVEHMPHVKNPGNVRRRYHDSVCRTGIGFGMEKTVFGPVAVPFVLHFGGVVFLRQFVHLAYSFCSAKVVNNGETGFRGYSIIHTPPQAKPPGHR